MDMRKQLKVQTVTQAQDETGEAGDVRAGDVRPLLHHYPLHEHTTFLFFW